jgi:hypothetical protein
MGSCHMRHDQQWAYNPSPAGTSARGAAAIGVLSGKPKPRRGGLFRLGLWRLCNIGTRSALTEHFNIKHPFLAVSSSARGFTAADFVVRDQRPAAPSSVRSPRERASPSGRRHDPHREAGTCKQAQHEDD